MNINTIKKLNKLNEDFYKITASDFDSSRQYFWQGWHQLTEHLDHFNQLKLLDLGCGNGRFYQFIKENFPDKKLDYLGIDNSVELLTFAQNKSNVAKNFQLQELDVISSLINKEDFIAENNFDVVVSFGVFHHIPSFDLRLKMLKYLSSKINDKGVIIISLWQFMKYERFRKKVTDDAELKKMNLSDLEKNDFIIDWKRGENALRYCHFFDNDEQNRLVKQSGLKLIKFFEADGKEEDVNSYLILKKIM